MLRRTYKKFIQSGSGCGFVKGARLAAENVRDWKSLHGLIDQERYARVLALQQYQAGQAIQYFDPNNGIARYTVFLNRQQVGAWLADDDLPSGVRNGSTSIRHALCGLAPDYANFDGTPHPTRWNKMSANFSFDAWRTASNWSVDWAWWGNDVRERQLSDRIQRFFVSQGISSYGDQFTLPGIPLENRHSTGLVATNAVASLAATGP